MGKYAPWRGWGKLNPFNLSKGRQKGKVTALRPHQERSTVMEGFSV